MIETIFHELLNQLRSSNSGSKAGYSPFDDVELGLQYEPLGEFKSCFGKEIQKDKRHK
ncbi:MAG: hypothetical protein LBC20_09775 [Planctomycetaceae bacterium]|nr:hypothetical protein [Planctomycetaceae bacterium]